MKGRWIPNLESEVGFWNDYIGEAMSSLCGEKKLGGEFVVDAAQLQTRYYFFEEKLIAASMSNKYLFFKHNNSKL